MEQESTANILGIHIDNITMNSALSMVSDFIEDKKKHYIVTPNPEIVMRAHKDEAYKKVLNHADLSIPDGIGIIWASEIKERVTGIDLMIEMCRLAEKNGWSIYLLGGQGRTPQKTVDVLKKRFPDLIVSGFSNSDPYQINASNIPKTDLLFVAYGAPKQEIWISEHLTDLPVKVAMGIGGAFDFIIGKQKRAPHVIQRLGMEWLWRLILEPWRWRRQLALIRFVILVIISRFQKKPRFQKKSRFKKESKLQKK